MDSVHNDRPGRKANSNRDRAEAPALLSHHRAELQASGVSAETITANGIYSESNPAAVGKLLNWSTSRAKLLGPVLVYPHFDQAGGAMDHAVVKPDRPRPRKDKPGKSIKYENPYRKPNRLYIPVDARAALADPTQAVIITEGCKKALAATQHGFPCVSSQGVWNWCIPRPKKDGLGVGPFELIPDLASINWKGRRVYICYDSDAATNTSVGRAEKVLASVLRKLGADVRIVRLPAEPDGVKNGLDDFLHRHGQEALRQRIEAAVVPDTEEPPKPPPLAEVLAGIGLALPLCHDATQTGFATVGRLTHSIRSTAFRQYLLQEYRKRNGGKVPSAEARAAALDAIEAAAVHDNPEHPVHVRFAGHMGRVYLHLADDASTVIEMDADGWRVCPNPPVRFRKPPGMLPLPMPRPGGSLDPLQKYVNVPEGSGFALVVGWLMGTFQPAGPFPVLVLLGEQGSAKTTTARVLKRLIDPSAAGVRTSPRDERDLMIQARNGWVLAFDNLSGLRGWFSDALCRLATGGGFGTRKLYTDDEEMIFDAKRPQIVNGIEDFITRADLLERSILTRHPPIPEENRRPESEFWKAFDAEHADLLGAVLDRVSAGLRELPRVRPEKLPRMADFALFAVACEQGAGEEEEFRSAYEENQAGAHEQALDSSLLPAAILAFMENREKWEGRPAELLAALQAHAPDPPPKDWPKQPNVLTNRLRRLAPNLRQVHRLNVDCDSREPGGKSGGKRKRVVRIERVAEKARERPSPPSPPSPDLDLDPGNPVILDVRQGDDGGGRSPPAEPETVPPHRPPPGATKPPESQGKQSQGDDGDDGDGPLHPFSGRTFTNDDRPHEWRG